VRPRKVLSHGVGLKTRVPGSTAMSVNNKKPENVEHASRSGPSRTSTPRSQIVALDLLRGLAALAVVLSHLRGSSFVEFGALPFAQQTISVAGFFAATRLGAD